LKLYNFLIFNLCMYLGDPLSFGASQGGSQPQYFQQPGGHLATSTVAAGQASYQYHPSAPPHGIANPSQNTSPSSTSFFQPTRQQAGQPQQPPQFMTPVMAPAPHQSSSNPFKEAPDSSTFPTAMFDHATTTTAATAFSLLSHQVLGNAHPFAPLNESGHATTQPTQAQKIFYGWLDWPVSHLKPYFQVTTQFVIQKVFLLAFPFATKNWQRRQAAEGSSLVMPGAVPVFSVQPSGQFQPPFGSTHQPYDPYQGHSYSSNPYASVTPSPLQMDDQPSTVSVQFALPRDDPNAPDLYIPIMAFVTYVLLAGLIYGLDGKFHPELLGMTASWAFFLFFFQSAFLKLACYLWNIGTEMPYLDLCSFVGYQFVGLVWTLCIGLLAKSSLSASPSKATAFFSFSSASLPLYSAWIYLSLAYGTFLLRTLRFALLPDATSHQSGLRRKRFQFMLLMVAFQFFISYFLLIIPSPLKVTPSV
jgi:YIF1